MKLAYSWDENLREVPVDPVAMRAHVGELRESLNGLMAADQRASVLGELGTRLRTLGELAEAERHLLEAVRIIAEEELGIRREVQQKLRLAHVYQWKSEFAKSNAMFAEMIIVCRENPEALIYLDFALQHAGKNLFDQGRWEQALECFEECLQIRNQKNSSQELLDSTSTAVARTRQLLGKN